MAGRGLGFWRRDGFMDILQYIASTPCVWPRYWQDLAGRLFCSHNARYAILLANDVFPQLPTHVPPFLRSSRNVGVLLFAGTVAVAGVTSYLMTRRKITPERDREAAAPGRPSGEHGADHRRGVLRRTHWINPGNPEGLFRLRADYYLIYRYMIAGVTV